MFDDRYLASRPIDLYFAGWRSNTYDLQQAGWQMSVSQDDRYHSMQIAFKNKQHKLYGISSHISRDLWGRDFLYSSPLGYPPITAEVSLASDFHISTAAVTRFEDFRPIDAEPQIMFRHQSMSQHLYFAPNLARTQEIIVPQHSVDDLLEMILQKQAVEREMIIKKRVREEMRGEALPQHNVHAQIISMVA